MSIGANIGKLRTKKGLSQKQLAEATSVTKGMIARIEIDDRVPPLLLAARIADVLGCTVDDLLKQ